MGADRVLLAQVGRERFAFPLADVLEVVEAPALSPVALAPAGVAGQCEHRGTLVPVLEGGVLLGVADDAAPGGGAPARATPAGAAAGVLLVLEADGARLALRADDVVDMVPVTPGARRPVPPSAGAASALLDAVLDLGDGIAALVAMDALRAAMRARLTTEGA